MQSTFKAWKAEDENSSEDEDDDNKANYEKLMTRLAANSATYGIMIKPHFKSFDHNNNGCVSKAKFRSVLMSFPPLIVHPNEWILIWKRFKHAWEINYVRFCEEITRCDALRRAAALAQDQASRFKLPADKKLVRSVSTGTGQSTPTLETVLQHMKNVVYLRRVDLRDECQDFDSLRTGRVSKGVFLRCLNGCGFNLSTQQIGLLLPWCASKKQIGAINFTKLCDALDLGAFLYLVCTLYSCIRTMDLLLPVLLSVY